MTRVQWRQPKLAKARHHLQFDANSYLDRAELLFKSARQCEADCDARCVDLYFETALLTRRSANLDQQQSRASDLHRSALIKLVTAGQRFERLDPRQQLSVYRAGRQQKVPIQHIGFVWEPDDFEFVDAVGDYRTNAFHCKHHSPGLGIPLVATCSGARGRPFLTQTPAFAATLTMNVADDSKHTAGLKGEQIDGISLNLFDPLRIDQVTVDGRLVPIAKDLSAPLTYRLQDERRTVLRAFVDPGSTEGESRLLMIEPFQRDKVPIVFIHGLLSDPFTWAEMINQLRSNADFRSRFQIWVFEYPTTQSFLASAAALRQQLAECRAIYASDDRQYSQLDNVVLVGHSLGGLIAKLQVAASGEMLWRSVANRAFEQVVMPPTTRSELRSSFFFSPSSAVSRVVFIGTPHQGSVYARRLVGRLGASLVALPAQRQWEHDQLVANNPGVFSEEVSRRIPTSIDLLDPDSELLRTIAKLPLEARVQLHSIIGEGRWTLGFGPSDGVVPVESAREPHTKSERFVAEKHGKLNKHPDAIDELLRVL